MATATNNSPAELVAILRAARIAGDRNLERNTKRELRERFGIELKFTAKHDRQFRVVDGEDATNG